MKYSVKSDICQRAKFEWEVNTSMGKRIPERRKNTCNGNALSFETLWYLEETKISTVDLERGNDSTLA